jgi:hypothetical protein
MREGLEHERMHAAEHEGKKALLAKLGYQVIASTGRTAEADYLKDLSGRFGAEAEASDAERRCLLHPLPERLQSIS